MDLTDLILAFHDRHLCPLVISVWRARENRLHGMSRYWQSRRSQTRDSFHHPSHTVPRRHGRPRTGNQDSRQASAGRLKSLDTPPVGRLHTEAAPAVPFSVRPRTNAWREIFPVGETSLLWDSPARLNVVGLGDRWRWRCGGGRGGTAHGPKYAPYSRCAVTGGLSSGCTST